MEFSRGGNLNWQGKSNKVKDEINSRFAETQTVNPYPVCDNNLFNVQVDIQAKREHPEVSGRIFYGDNLGAMEYLHANGNQIDLIYIDPPYLSSANYSSTVKVLDQTGMSKKLTRPVFVDPGYKDINAYLEHIYPRLQNMYKLLAPDGSIFVHLDWHVSHYVKILLDEIFSPMNFINEIVWCYGGGSGTRRHFHRKHDLIFWYAKGDNYKFNQQYRPYTPGTIQRGLTQVKGNKYHLNHKGALMHDWWTDIPKILSPTAAENLKFPTQKPEALIRRIIASASNPGDIVADFYGGSGTTAAVCEDMNRNWIISDDSSIAIQTIITRLCLRKTRPFCINTNLNTSASSHKAKLTLKAPLIQLHNENSVLINLGIAHYQPVQDKIDDIELCSLIDFWEVDLNHEEYFISDVQIVRAKRQFDNSLPLEISFCLPLRKEYRIAVKVHDIFGGQGMEEMKIDF